MKKSGSRLGLAAAGLAWSAMLLLSGTSAGTIDMQKDAKAQGFTVEGGCLWCHGEKLPKKGASTYNERGQWLVSEKGKRKAEKVDVAWLKEYPGDKK